MRQRLNKITFNVEYHPIPKETPSNKAITEPLHADHAASAFQLIARSLLTLIGCSFSSVLLLSGKYLLFLLMGHCHLLPEMSLPEQFSTQNATELTHNLLHGRVFLLQNGNNQSVLKLYPTQDAFEHSLYVQTMIEGSGHREVTVSMMDFDREERWIHFESGIPIKSSNETKYIQDAQSQIKHIHHVLQSLGILHHDLWIGNFLRSKDDQSNILIFDFGNALMLKEIKMWFNSHHVAHVMDWFTKSKNSDHATLWDETQDFEDFAEFLSGATDVPPHNWNADPFKLSAGVMLIITILMSMVLGLYQYTLSLTAVSKQTKQL